MAAPKKRSVPTCAASGSIPTNPLQNIRWNYVFLLYGQQRYEEALDRFIPLLDDTVDVERVRTDARRLFGWLRQGTLSAIPDTAREDLTPEDWVRLGYPDSAAAQSGRTRFDGRGDRSPLPPVRPDVR